MAHNNTGSAGTAGGPEFHSLAHFGSEVIHIIGAGLAADAGEVAEMIGAAAIPMAEFVGHHPFHVFHISIGAAAAPLGVAVLARGAYGPPGAPGAPQWPRKY